MARKGFEVARDDIVTLLQTAYLNADISRATAIRAINDLEAMEKAHGISPPEAKEFFNHGVHPKDRL